LRLLAAICTNRPPQAVRPALAALAKQTRADPAAAALLVTSGLSAAAVAPHRDQAERLGAAFAAGPAGVSAARNRALAEAADFDLIAYLDDDVLPSPDWLRRLCDRWGAAGEDVAVIGGAVLPRFEGPAPVWLGRGLWPAYSLLDLGPGEVELDPGRELDAWGANLSFRVGALRAAGGFDESLGPRGPILRYGEDTEVQRRLQSRGLRLLYAGDVRAEHRIGPDRLRLRSLWRRELHRGLSAGEAGEAFAPAAGRALKAAGGSLAAVLRGDRPLAAERLARAARNTGAALAPVAARRR
jgi:hypothetical protein